MRWKLSGACTGCLMREPQALLVGRRYRQAHFRARRPAVRSRAVPRSARPPPPRALPHRPPGPTQGFAPGL